MYEPVWVFTVMYRVEGTWLPQGGLVCETESQAQGAAFEWFVNTWLDSVGTDREELGLYNTLLTFNDIARTIEDFYAADEESYADEERCYPVIFEVAKGE